MMQAVARPADFVIVYGLHKETRRPKVAIVVRIPNANVLPRDARMELAFDPRDAMHYGLQLIRCAFKATLLAWWHRLPRK